jgi:hypothetical protein
MVRMTLPVAIGCAWSAVLTLGGSTAWPQQVEAPKDLAATQTESKTSASLHRTQRDRRSRGSSRLGSLAERERSPLVLRSHQVRKSAAWVSYKGKEVWRVEAASKGIFAGVKTTPYGTFYVKTIQLDVDGK